MLGFSDTAEIKGHYSYEIRISSQLVPELYYVC
jgi:hypothetical protein